MVLPQKIKAYLASPFPLWENELTALLIQHEWDSVADNGITPHNYSTAISHDVKFVNTEIPKFAIVGGHNFEKSVYLEYPSFDLLGDFYHELGLEPFDYPKEEKTQLIRKLLAAYSIFDAVPSAKEDILLLVKRIQVLKQHDDEIDTSYSHPDIPFSIFVSLCKDNSQINNLRVAESILHETMHLKLTLIEKHIDLVVPGTEETFYSPWRDQQRPVRGVLHGLFVFKAILEIYKAILAITCKSNEKDYFFNRISEIENEFLTIASFVNSNGLTLCGKLLVSKLLQLEIWKYNPES